MACPGLPPSTILAKRRVIDRPDKGEGRKSTGGRGEDVAALYLRRRGCTILARNWHANPGEIDIIASCPLETQSPPEESSKPATILTFVEVRTRHGREGLAEESISPRKANSMISAAYSYMAVHDLDPEITSWRIDLVAIAMSGRTITAINWVQGAIEGES